MESKEMEQTAADTIIFPSLSDRVQSTFIDTVFIIILMFVFAAILDKYENPPDWIRVAIFFGIWGIYEPLCTTLGFTLGNFIKGIRVRKSADPTKKINILQAIVRYIVKIWLGWLSFITMHLSQRKRAIHDLAVGSLMIKI